MKNFFTQLYDIRKGEQLLMLLMVGLNFVYMVSFYLLKPARDGIFLAELGALQLPFIYIVMAVISVPFTVYLSQMLQRSNIFLVINGTIIFLILNLVALRIILPYDQSWVYYLFYIWVSLYGIFITSQFWLFANYIFDAAQSKRLFGFLNIGAILGAITGSELSNFLINTMEYRTESLIYFCIGAMFIGLALINKIYRREIATAPDTLLEGNNHRDNYPAKINESFLQLFKSIYRSKYQGIIVLIVAITMIASTFIDFQFKTIAVESYTDRGELTSFMGRFYGLLSFAALIVQVFLSHIIIRTGGVGAAVVIRPIGLIFTTAFLVINPTLIAAAFMRGVDGSMRYSIDKTGRELLFMALPQQIKKKTKIFIDVFVDRFARGLAGFLLFLLVVVWGFSVQQLGYIVAGSIVLWLILAWIARSEYINQFRNSLLKHQIRADRYDLQVHDQVTLDLIRETLEEGNDSQIIYALNLLEEPVSKKMADCLLPLLENDNAQIRLRALKLLAGIKEMHFTQEVAPMLRDSNLEVRLEAIFYLCEHSGSSASEVMGKLMNASDIEIKSSALACMGRHGEDGNLKHLDDSLIDDLLAYDGRDYPIIHAQTAIALGNVRFETAKKYLPRMLSYESDLVVREAILAMGKQKEEVFIPYLAEKLLHKKYSQYAIKALAMYGTDIIPTIDSIIRDHSRPLEIRKNTFKVFRNLPCQRTVDHVIDITMELVDEPVLKLHGIKTLNHLRSNYKKKLYFDESLIDKLLVDEIRNYYHLLSIYKVVESDDHGEQRMLLIRALEENMETTLERIFRIIGLEYPPDDIYGAYLGLRSISSEIRADAIEFLDNLISNELKTYLFPIVDPGSSRDALQVAKNLFDIEIESYEEGLLKLLEGYDLWLKTCAVYFVSPRCPSILRDKVREFAEHENSLLRETAQLVIQQYSEAISG